MLYGLVLAALIFSMPAISSAASAVKPYKPQARVQTPQPSQSDKKQRPVAFRCYVSVGEGATGFSKYNSVKVEGIIGDDRVDVSLSMQERVGGKALSRFNWTGSISGKPHAALVQTASGTRLREAERDGVHRTGGGYSVFEVTLRYPGGAEVTGTPTVAKGWKEFLNAVKETALSRKSDKLTGIRCYLDGSASGPGDRAPGCSIEMECSIGSSNTILSFGMHEKVGGRTQPSLRWSGEIEGELHGRLVEVARATRLKAVEKKSTAVGSTDGSGSAPDVRDASHAGKPGSVHGSAAGSLRTALGGASASSSGGVQGGESANAPGSAPGNAYGRSSGVESCRLEITLRYPDGERTGAPSNPEDWRDILGAVERIARARK